jgi:hypothetical protein
MDSVVVRCLAAAVLIGSAALKVARPRQSREALSALAPPVPGGPAAAWALVVAVELALGVGVAAGSETASYAAGVLMACFAAVLVSEILRGHAGRPCGCFGSHGKIGWPAVARNAVLGALFLALPSLGVPRLAATGWLAVGLAAAVAGLVGLGIAVLALAREVGALRLAIAPQGALEIPDEGPELGSRADLTAEFSPGAHARTMLAVFSSDGCPVCRALEPAIDFAGRDPLVALRVFDEHADQEVWRKLDVPGSPYAVALDLDGTVLAKGTFNTLGQLESVLATAVGRRDAVHA